MRRRATASGAATAARSRRGEAEAGTGESGGGVGGATGVDVGLGGGAGAGVCVGAGVFAAERSITTGWISVDVPQDRQARTRRPQATLFKTFLIGLSLTRIIHDRLRRLSAAGVCCANGGREVSKRGQASTVLSASQVSLLGRSLEA